MKDDEQKGAPPTGWTPESGDEVPAATGLAQLPVLAVRDIVIYPQMLVPLFVGREKSVNALNAAMKGDKRIFVLAQKEAKTKEPLFEDLYDIGTVCSIIQLIKLADGNIKVLVEGRQRAATVSGRGDGAYLSATLEFVEEVLCDEVECEALVRSLITTFEKYVKMNRRLPLDLVMSVSSLSDPSKIADAIAAQLSLKLTDKQNLLELVNPRDRLERLLSHLESEIEILEMEKRIRSRVKQQMEKTQKEYYLNEQINAIQKELGEGDEFKAEIKEFESLAKKEKLSKEAQEKISREIKKLKLMSPMSAEATVVRNYIDWILSLPWGETTEEKHDLEAAQAVLDKDHYGLRKPKDRILEYLAVRGLTETNKGPILCLVGPPGVGKTSLGASIARATGRQFVRLSLGGVRDEAEIRGHRRTYIGALPGKIIQSLRKAGSANPVFLLDEVDKMSMDFRGDPSSALLEVLDPEQNATFNDHYLDLDFDLSKVMFIATANTLHTIPPPLQDRMEIISMSSYSESEKLHIAKNFLIPKQLEANGLQDKGIRFSDSVLLHMIRRYTREAGVRTLEKTIASICRKIAREVVQKKKGHTVALSISRLRGFLGPEKYQHGIAEQKDEVGLATGLAYTESGGDLLGIEATVMPGKGKLTVTGKLGDIMQESAQAALSYVRRRAESLGLEPGFYQSVDIHLHVPEGATPKDGPSAGITMATALISALTKVPIRRDLAMTGEITLRGRVLPIGGLKEKLLAAHRGGMKAVLIPKDNEKDLHEIPAVLRKELAISSVSHMDQVVTRTLIVDGDFEAFFKKRCEERDAMAASKLVPPPNEPPTPPTKESVH